MDARFPGRCLGGGDRIRVGDDIARDRWGWSHRNHVGIITSYDGPRTLRDAVAALSPAERRGWTAVLYDNEFFDGEDEIALSVLDSMKAKGALVGYRARVPADTYEMYEAAR